MALKKLTTRGLMNIFYYINDKINKHIKIYNILKQNKNKFDEL
jgi:hypothetical protein